MRQFWVRAVNGVILVVLIFHWSIAIVSETTVTVAAQQSTDDSSSSSGGSSSSTGSGNTSSGGNGILPLPSYSGWTYILALGIIVAFADGFGIGANDVANSFATSVGSGSLTLFQAVCIGLFTESAGALLLGKNTSETIRGKIVNVALFNSNPSLLMLGMFCALIGSSTFVITATRLGLPVSTTHTIVGSIAGIGIAAFGVDGVVWSGIGTIAASWLVSPALAGFFAVLLWKSTEMLILRQSNSYEAALLSIPFYFFITASFVSFFMVYKGISRIDISALIGTGGAVGVSLGIGAVAAALAYAFYVPFVRRYADKLTHAHSLALMPREQGRDDATELSPSSANGSSSVAGWTAPLASQTPTSSALSYGTLREENDTVQKPQDARTFSSSLMQSKPVENSYYAQLKSYLFHGVNVDVVHHADLAEMHSKAPKYESKTEVIYSVLQILTAAFASFAHGSNDIANAVGPLSTIWAVYNSDYQLTVKSSTDTPIWVVLVCTVGLDVGLFTYGYHIMRELGNKITFHSPARGFCMELAAGFAVLIASKMGWPISTTQCITGATLAVGLSTGSLGAVNWRRSLLFLSAWMLTVPLAGLLAGLLFSFIAYAPKGYEAG